MPRIACPQALEASFRRTYGRRIRTIDRFKSWLSIITHGIINMAVWRWLILPATPESRFARSPMYACPHCARAINLGRSHDFPTMCPYCGEELRHESNDRWTDIARVTNLAEAGFLSDELVGLGIDARIYQLEEFSAITDRWASAYLIQVPTAVARDAAAQIRRHLAEEPEEADAGALGFRFSADGQAVDPLFWRPVALVVLAGVASFLLGQKFSEQNVERRPLRGGSLSTAVRAIGRPFVSESAPGEPQYRLSLDRRQQFWHLDTDRNGDGIFDTRHEIQVSSGAW
jgi:hypothetical protein